MLVEFNNLLFRRNFIALISKKLTSLLKIMN